jgi:predicted extracellular nuclease
MCSLSGILLGKRYLWAALGIISMLSVTQTCMGAESVSCVQIANDIQGARISDIQGASHQSPLICHRVIGVPGVVTSLRKNGFFMQDPEPDGSPATSEAVFVFTNSSPLVREGDHVLVDGVVQEYCYSGKDLSSTEIATDENPLPCCGMLGEIAPTNIGIRGRMPPDRIIEDDAAEKINGQSGEIFDPQSDGLDFYESLEGMLVQVDDPVIVGRIKFSNALVVVGDNGTAATFMSDRGGIVALQGDLNPERILIEFKSRIPDADVGDMLEGPVVGILTYRDAGYRIEADGVPKVVHRPRGPDMARPFQPDELTIATFNVENLFSRSGNDKLARLASQIVDSLHSPDILALQEIQDNNGDREDAVVDADWSFSALVRSIAEAGGPEYQFLDIDPQRGADGGAANGSANIRVGFLYRTDRGLSFPAVAGGDAVTPVEIINEGDGAHLSFNPGRVDPMNLAFENSRKPLAAEFMFRGDKLFVIANHFISKMGDDPLYGNNQPPRQLSEAQRHSQALAVYDFAGAILKAEPDANVVVLGDLNDPPFSRTLALLEGGLLHNVLDRLPPEDQYTTNFEGNSQALDHILISGSLEASITDVDIVHLNSGLADQASDHDPVLIRISFYGTMETALRAIKEG